MLPTRHEVVPRLLREGSGLWRGWGGGGDSNHAARVARCPDYSGRPKRSSETAVIVQRHQGPEFGLGEESLGDVAPVVDRPEALDVDANGPGRADRNDAHPSRVRHVEVEGRGRHNMSFQDRHLYTFRYTW